MEWFVELSGWWIVLICAVIAVIAIWVGVAISAAFPVLAGLNMVANAVMIIAILYVWCEGNRDVCVLASVWEVLQ